MVSRTQSALEASLGVDLRAVRVHTDARSAAAVDRLSARAVTVGTHIFLGSREQPTDLALMGHETAHVVQQQGGSTVQRKSDDHLGDPLEREADHAATAVQRGEHIIIQGRTGTLRPQFLFDWVRRGVSAVGRGIRAVAGAVADVVGNIIERAVNYIRERARSIPGYDLLGFILGRDPLTQQPVERNAVNLIRGLLGLIPGGAAMFENLQRAQVLQRAFEWVSTELGRLNLTWAVIRGAIDRFLSTLGPGDLLNLGGVFERARAIFGPILSRIIAFASAAGRKILEFIFEGALALGGAAAQRVLSIFRRIGATFNLIVSDPVRFLGNLINAVKGGFQRFAANILDHLRTALFDWLFGALQGAGLRLPPRFNLEGIISIILQILGLTYARLRERLVRLIGEPAVATLERVFEFVRILVTQGLAAAWQKILEFASGLVDTVIEGIRNWVITSIVRAAVTRLATMFNPVGAIINAIITIYNTVMFVVERAQQIAAFVEAVLDSIDNIARGNIGAAVAYVERTLGRILSLVISFLARLIGLGGISNTIRNIIRRIQAVVDRAIDRVVNWIRERARSLLQRGREAVAGVVQWWRARRRIVGRDRSQHSLYFSGEGARARVMFASNPMPVEQFISSIQNNPDYQSPDKRSLIQQIQSKVAAIRTAQGLPAAQQAQAAQQINTAFNEMGPLLEQLVGSGEYATEANPLPLAYTKRRLTMYPLIHIGPRAADRVPQAELAAGNVNAILTHLSASERNAWTTRGNRIEAYQPHERKALPDGGPTIGITSQWRTEPGKKFRLIPRSTTGGGLINRTLAPYGYRARSENMDGDHVLEMQIGGENVLENLWPLDASENRSSGSALAGARLRKPDGSEVTMEALKNRARRTPTWLIITSTR